MGDPILIRRGFSLGHVKPEQCKKAREEVNALKLDWQEGYANKLSLSAKLDQHQKAIQDSASLYQQILNGQDCGDLLAAPPYQTRIESQFESLGSSYNEGDDQEITTVFFDAIEDVEKPQDQNEASIRAEDLWLKVSWLSFYEGDDSLRFRFSFGVDFEEDVASDPVRQFYAAELAESVFPESTLVSKNHEIHGLLCQILDTQSLSFVERIIYFNAPNGGAYFHHDRERGHAGVIYAQISGATFWLALPKNQLVSEITEFVLECAQSNDWPPSLTEMQKVQLSSLAQAGESEISKTIDSLAHDALIHVINECEDFVQLMITKGYGFIIEAGEFLLLPQGSDKCACWHSVFTIGDEAGQALSFAIRT